LSFKNDAKTPHRICKICKQESDEQDSLRKNVRIENKKNKNKIFFDFLFF
jgi:hypothetical protein